nr:MAG TPA: hypothetical protein [Caudoviricetes sp.]
MQRAHCSLTDGSRSWRPPMRMEPDIRIPVR